MVYAYIRVSKIDQSMERQIISIKSYCPDIQDKNIYMDKVTGKNDQRKEYLKLKKCLKNGDEIIIHELDRLSRNKGFLQEQLLFFKQNNIILRVLELPTTLHTFTEETAWVGEMVNNIILEVYSSLAQHEREKISKRTIEGLNAAREKGHIGGRPTKSMEKIELAFLLYKQGYTIEQIADISTVSKTCFYSYLKMQTIELIQSEMNDTEIIEKLGCTLDYIKKIKRVLRTNVN